MTQLLAFFKHVSSLSTPQGGHWADSSQERPHVTALTCWGSARWSILVSLLGSSSSWSCLPVAPLQALFWQTYLSPSAFFCFCWTGFGTGFGKRTCRCTSEQFCLVKKNSSTTWRRTHGEGLHELMQVVPCAPLSVTYCWGLLLAFATWKANVAKRQAVSHRPSVSLACWYRCDGHVSTWAAVQQLHLNAAARTQPTSCFSLCKWAAYRS